MVCRFWRVALVVWLSALGGCGLDKVGPDLEALDAYLAQQDAAGGDVDEDTSGSGDAGDVGGAGDADGVTADTADGGGADAGCTPASCDDGDPCTEDLCGDQGCVNGPSSVGACDDGDACTEGDGCKDGKCVGGATKDCTDANPCTVDSCNTSTGACAHVAAVAGTACDDGDACTQAACGLKGGVTPACEATSTVSCDDGNACTEDSCDAVKGCANLPAKVTCDDGDACTTASCEGTNCKATGPVSCDDEKLCTDDSCDPKTGCANKPNAAPCDDGSSCTVKDVCTSGTCAGTKALFEGTWSGPTYTGVMAVLPTSDGGFLGAGAQAPVAGAPQGRLWRFKAGDPLPQTSQTPMPGVGIFDIVELPGEATFVVGMRYTTRFDSWASRVDPSAMTVYGPMLLGAPNETHMWMAGAAVGPKTLALVGNRSVAGKGEFGRVAFATSKGTWTKTAPADIAGLDLRAAAGSTGVVFACGLHMADKRAWLAAVDTSGKVLRSRPIDGAKSECLALRSLSGGGLLAAGSVEIGGDVFGRLWRLRQHGGRVAVWTSAQQSVLTTLGGIGDHALFAGGRVKGKSGERGLLVRFGDQLRTAAATELGGATDRWLNAIAWHPAGYVVGAGASRSAANKKDERPWVLGLSAWGQSTCDAACAKVAAGTCLATDACTTSTCVAGKGCVATARVGACHDGKACAAPGACDKGACKGGGARFRVEQGPASGAGTWVAAVALPGGDVVSAVSGASFGATLQRWPSTGGQGWSNSTKGSPAWLVATGEVTWAGGSPSPGGPGWLGRFDAKGQDANINAGPAPLAAGAPLPGGQLITFSGAPDVTARRWSDTGKAIGSQVSTLSISGGAQLAALDAAAGVGDVVWVAGHTADQRPVLARMDATGTVAWWRALPGGDQASSLDFTGAWGSARLSVGSGGPLLIAAHPSPAGAPAAWLSQQTVRAAFVGASGHLRHVARPFAKAPASLHAAAALGDGSTLLVGASKGGQGSKLDVALLGAGGDAQGAWDLSLANVLDPAVAATVTSDGAVALVVRGKSATTGQAGVRLHRLSPWGHDSCAIAGPCGEESAASCDTGLPCTPGTCKAPGGCAGAAAKGCLPDAPCAGQGTCKGVVCEAGKATTDCDDTNPCTNDACAPASGCSHVATDAASCDDGALCTVSDACKGATCTGKPKDCDDGVKCTVDACNPKSGSCSNTATDKLCDDANACTTNTCDPKQGCAKVDVALGQPCGGGKVCSGSVCQVPWATKVALGDGFACALGVHGKVRCWGKGGLGQLGHGAEKDSEAPVLVKLTEPAVAVALGKSHACAVGQSGAVWCWGDNGQGQAPAGGLASAVPAKIAGVTGATHVGAGVAHSCAIAGGKLWCWGANGSGQIGASDGSPKLADAALAGLTGVALGAAHTCAITGGGGVACFGAHAYGQLGHGAKVGGTSSKPVVVKTTTGGALSGVNTLVAGPSCTWAQLGGSSTLVGWGGDRFGLGQTDGDKASGASVFATGYTGTGYAGVAVAVDHMCVLTTAPQKVLCTGVSAAVALGEEGSTTVGSPTQVKGLWPLKSIAAGPKRTCGVRVDGAVVCWGQDADGAAAQPDVVPGSAP